MADARQGELELLREAKAALDATRQQVQDAKAALEARLAAGDESEPAEGEEGSVLPTVEELEAKIEELEDKSLEAADNFTTQLVGFINADPPIVGEPMSEVQQEAIRMKSSEDLVLARGYIEEGGDYQRAIRIYQDALAVDPGNEDLEAALAAAEELRYVTPERFAEVENGMTQDDVRATLGQVNLRNIRDYKDRNVIAWFYPTGEDGAAAAVYFRERRGEQVVYETKYAAVPSKSEAQGQGE